jgi:hypothetical protein
MTTITTISNGAAGADGSGFTGTVGNAGANGGGALAIANNTDVVFTSTGGANGGNGGKGRGLVAGDAKSTISTTSGINGNVTDLTALAGINNGDSFQITIDGVVKTITINTGENLLDVAAKIKVAFTNIAASATTTGTDER